MRLYLIVTAVLFVALAGLHIWRLADEGGGLLSEPDFVVASLVALALAVWAVALLRRLPREPE